MQRSLSEILASQKKMLVNRGEDPEKIKDDDMAFAFQKHLKQIHAWLAEQKNISTYFVDYNLLLTDPKPEIRRINQFLGGKLIEAKLLSAIDPALYRQRK